MDINKRAGQGVGSVRYLTVTAMLSAIAFVLMFFDFSIPVLIPNFIKMDLSYDYLYRRRGRIVKFRFGGGLCASGGIGVQSEKEPQRSADRFACRRVCDGVDFDSVKLFFRLPVLL